MYNRIYPLTRLRRNRTNSTVRKLCAENLLSANKLLWPLFIKDSNNKYEKIEQMPGVFRLNLESFRDTLNEACDLGIAGVMLFPNIESKYKDSKGSFAINESNIVFQALEVAKPFRDKLLIICDCALDPYTSHGHDGILNVNGVVDNDKTIETLVLQSVMLAKHGACTIAPSDMMDGRIGVIRQALEAKGYQDTRLMSYSAKYASSYYDPFRSAISSADLINGDKKSYQMDFANSHEAIQESSLDISEGADWLIVKPGMPYLDIVYKLSNKFSIPIFPYQVSGEYQMLKYAMTQQKDKGMALLMETTMAFFRAGATGLISYFAPEIAKALNSK